uniref:Uncharacterized protein n=1 Tax=Arundo donax TaxID=35708 RepID=A0A0A8Y0Y1_ARUDO
MACYLHREFKVSSCSFVTFVHRHHSFILCDLLYRALLVRIGWRNHPGDIGSRNLP